MKKEIKNILLTPFNALYKISPELEQRLMFRLKMGYRLDLRNPKTFNEKLNWLKINYRNDLLPRCADKYLARGYIEECGFGEYLPKLYWHGTDPEDIPFESLPESFVIKSTSGSGNNIIVKDKSQLNINQVKKQIKKWLREKYLLAYGEWHYEQIKPSIIIEEFLSDGVHMVPEDYKLFCFNNFMGGTANRVGCVAVDIGRLVEHKRNIYDANFALMQEVSFGFDRDFEQTVNKPCCFNEMCAVASRLSRPFPHSRIDFFVIGERFYIGEITFFNGAGYDRVTPDEYNLLMGSWIALPN